MIEKEKFEKVLDKVVKALFDKKDLEILVSSIGSGFQEFKIPPKSTVGEVKLLLFYVLSDLAIDLEV